MTVRLHPTNNTIRVGRRLWAVHPQTARLLWMLLCHPMVSLPLYVETEWAEPPLVPRRSLHTNIKYLRRILAGSSWQIVTYSGRGYGLRSV